MARSVLAATTLLAVLLVSAPSSVARAEQQALAGHRSALEERKLELEIAALEAHGLPGREIPAWMTVVFGLAGGVATSLFSLWTARRARQGALDQSVHEKRLEAYAALVMAAEPLAVFFPPGEPGDTRLNQQKCALMGRDMSHWYFAGGGLLLSVKARDAYFTFARALVRASSSTCTQFNAPEYPENANEISVQKLDAYRAALNMRAIDVETWTFGAEKADKSKAEECFKDYVFLQALSSQLRSELSADLGSRRRPA